jgi:hypothetical protein
VLHREVHCKKIMLVCCIVRYIVRRKWTPTLSSYNVPHDTIHHHYLLTMYLTMQHTIIIFLQCTSRCNTPTLSSYNVPHDATHHHYLLTMYRTMQHTIIIFLQCTSRCNTPTLSSYNVPRDATHQEDNDGVLHREVHCKKIMLVCCIVRYIVRR